MTNDITTDGVINAHPDRAYDFQRGNMIPTEMFDYDGLDSIEDRFKEAMEIPGGVADLIRDLSADAANEKAADAVARVICLIADARDPKLAVAALAHSAGLNSFSGKSGADIARAHGVTKQAFSQIALGLQRALGLPPSRGQRTMKARESMAKSYRERHGVKPSPRTTRP